MDPEAAKQPNRCDLLGHPMASWDVHPSCRMCLHKTGLFCTRLSPCDICVSWSPQQWNVWEASELRSICSEAVEVGGGYRSKSGWAWLHTRIGPRPCSGVVCSGQRRWVRQWRLAAVLKGDRPSPEPVLKNVWHPEWLDPGAYIFPDRDNGKRAFTLGPVRELPLFFGPQGQYAQQPMTATIRWD